jgi:radical SAM protein with 4Fe4S-binding SPASM domain
MVTQTSRSEQVVKVNNVQYSLDTPEREAEFNRRRALGHEKEYALNREQWFNYPVQQRVDEYPLHVDIELSSACNLRCPMCPTVTEQFKTGVDRKLMAFPLVKKIIDEIGPAGVYSIRLSWIGEALMHKQFIQSVRYAKEKGIKEVSTLTNGQKLLDKEFCRKLVEAELDWITVSIDGVDETYEAIRHPITFPQICEALANLRDERARQGKVKPAMKIQGVWPAVKKDLEKYLNTFSPLVDLIYTNPLVDYLHNDDPDSIDYIPNFTCYQPFQRLVIRSNGDCVMCSNDDLGEHVIGDLNTQSVKEVWRGPAMQKIRELHVKHDALREIPACRRCYVPRVRELETVNVRGRTVAIENYKGRLQIIGQ